MEKLEDPGRLTVDLNLLRTVERKLESNAENPGPRNVSECLDLFRILSGNSSQNTQKSKTLERLGMSRNVSGFRPFFVSLFSSRFFRPGFWVF